MNRVKAKKIVVLFSGKGTNFAYIVQQLHQKGFEVVFALTNNPNAQGIDVSRKYSIPYEIVEPKHFDSREAYDRVIVDRVKSYKPDLTVLAGFMRILTPLFTNEVKAINLHPSLLPRHKGLHAIEKSYSDEYSAGGVSVHYVTSELDGGEIIVQKEIEKKSLSFEMYEKKIKSLEKEALVEAIKRVL